MQMLGKLHAGCGVYMQVLYCLRYSSQATDVADVHEAAMLPDSPQGRTALFAGRISVATTTFSTPS